MILTPHILAGAAIISQTPSLALGAVLAYLSHYLLDTVGHAEYEIRPLKYLKTSDFRLAMLPLLKILTELLFSFSLLVYLALKFNYPLWLVLAGGLLGAGADAITFIRITLPIKIRLLDLERRFHRFVHYDRTKKYAPIWGYATQLLVITTALLAFVLM